MIIFNNTMYELFFSNNLPPLIALNYADELFFEEFKKLCGTRYRILSIIRKGWQQKYILSIDIKELIKVFLSKIEDNKWASSLLETYEKDSKELRLLLDSISSKDYSKLKDSVLICDIKEVRNKSAILDAMSNMLHLFSSLVGYRFFDSLNNYDINKDKINQNFIFYTQPIKESRFAKINMKEIEDKIHLSKRDKNFSDILRIGAFVKDDVSELLDLRKNMMENLFKEISHRINCVLKDLEYLQLKEIETFLLKKKSPGGIIIKRKNITILFYHKESLEVYEGEDAEEFIKKANMHEIIDNYKSSILKGQTASLGCVSGKVIVAKDSIEAIKKMKKGNILVAPYTAVEYVTAMKKAAAIITETGGITSHAAIVSRELKIPCVIGVKDATKILNDGDFITVNADEGIIKVL